MSILEKIDSSDALKIKTKIIDDRRGNFCKIFQDSYFDELGGFQPKESYISLSKKGVLRGFHLQVNEAIHGKIITCLAGEILDVFVDLREGPSFGKVFSITLSSSNKDTIFIPKGYGHAFLNTKDQDATILYLVETEHSPTNDVGVKWDSVKFNWPIENPILSDRDKNLPGIEEFQRL